MIEFNCSYCGKHFGVGEDFAGRSGQCPSCGNRIEVPTPDGVGRFDELTAEQRVALLSRGMQDISLRYREQREQYRVLYQKAQQLQGVAQNASLREQELRIVKARLEEAQALVEDLRHDLTQTSRGLGTVTEQRDRLSEEVIALKQEAMQLRSSLPEIDLLRADLARLKLVEREVDDLRAATGPADGAAVDARLGTLSAELDDIRLERDALKQQLDERERRIGAFEIDIQQKDATLSATKAELAPLHAIESRCTALETETEGLRERLREAEKVQDALRSELQDRALAQGAASAQADECRKAADRSSEETVLLRASLSQLEERLRDAEYRSGKADVFEQERDAAQALCKELETQLAQVRSELGLLAQSSDHTSTQAANTLIEAQQRAEDLANERVQRAQLEAERVRLTDLNAALEGRLDDMRARLTLLEEGQRAAYELSARVSESQAQVERLTSELSLAAQALGAAEAKASSAAEELAKKDAELAELRERHAVASRQGLDTADRTSGVSALEDTGESPWDMDGLPDAEEDEEPTFVPEIIEDDAPLSDEMMKTLLRFISPEEERS